jgi:hypothetical protein
MGLLQFNNGDSFASGVLRYEYRPASSTDVTNRIFIPIETISGFKITCVLDTGAPWIILDPNIAAIAGFNQQSALYDATMQIRRKQTWTGKIARLDFILKADEGADLDFQSTVFVPDDAEDWNRLKLPSFLGQVGFLERIRFAIDPNENKFYFGSL